MTEFGWYVEMDAVELARAVRSRSVSPMEVIEAALGRIAETNEALNACSVVLEQEARAAARDAGRALESGGPVGPLHGVPVVVKDAIWVKGAPATLGSHAMVHFRAPEDAAVVRRLRAAGAIVVAKSTIPEFMWRGYQPESLHGIARNPWDLTRTTGASSGGSAAGVATGMTPLALGTDAAGSVRGPAAYCGIVGHKPTYGLVPRTPGFEEFRTTNVIGPMTRTVRDAALAMNVLAGPDPWDYLCIPAEPPDFEAALRTTDVAQLSLAWAPDIAGARDAEPPVRSVVTAAIDRLTDAHWRLDAIHPELPDVTGFSYTTLRGEYGRPNSLREDLLSPFAQDIFAEMDQVSAQEYHAAHVERARFNAWWEGLLAGYDVLLIPAVPKVAPTIDADVANTNRGGGALMIANLTGQPALSMPIGITDDGLPVALEIMAPRGRDELCLAVAAAIERLLPPRRAPEIDAAAAQTTPGGNRC